MKEPITFPSATGSWGHVTHVGIWSAKRQPWWKRALLWLKRHKGSRRLPVKEPFVGVVFPSKSIGIDDTATFKVENLSIDIT